MTEQVTSDTVETQEQPTATPAAKGDDAAPKPEPVMIPKERLDAEIAKTREYKKAAEELAKLKQEQADAEAKRTGDIEKFTKERDTYKAEAEQWRTYASAKLEGLTEQLDDAGKAILADLEDAPLAKRLAIAEKLAGSKKTEPGFGTHGGKGGAQETGGLIPSHARASRVAYEQWLGEIASSGDMAQLAILTDTGKRQKLDAEARALFG